MKWLCPLYVGENAREVASAAIAGIRAKMPGRYDGFVLLALSPHEGCSVELMKVLVSRIPHTRERMKVVGLAKDQEEAEALLLSLLKTCLTETGSPDLSAYFERFPEEAWTEEGEVILWTP